MDDEDIENEPLVKARELMQLFGLKKLPWHKGLSTNLHLWKKAGEDHTTCTGITCTIYCCPMRHWCDCKCTILVGRGDGSLTLERCDLHDMKSHVTNKFRYLKYEQIISLSLRLLLLYRIVSSCDSKELANARQSDEDHWCAASPKCVQQRQTCPQKYDSKAAWWCNAQ